MVERPAVVPVVERLKVLRGATDERHEMVPDDAPAHVGEAVARSLERLLVVLDDADEAQQPVEHGLVALEIAHGQELRQIERQLGPEARVAQLRRQGGDVEPV